MYYNDHDKMRFNAYYLLLWYFIFQFLYSILAEDKCLKEEVKIIYYEFPLSVEKTDSPSPENTMTFNAGLAILIPVANGIARP